MNHGTNGGYQAHKRRGEDACEECMDAHRDAARRMQARLLYDALGAARPGDWVRQAECAKRDLYKPDLWHDERESATARAKAVCKGCPVKAECLLWSFETKQPYGTFGGVSADDRARLLSGAA